MGDVIKGIGKVVSAPVRAIGHAAAHSGIPGISNLGGVAEGVGNAVGGKGSFFGGLGQAAKAGLPIAGTMLGGPLGGMLGGALGGSTDAQGGSGLSGLAGSIGKALSQPNMLGNANGNLDLGKILGLGGGIAGMIGQHNQRKSAERYNNASINQRNALMSKILAPQNYGTNLNQQASASPGN